MCVCVCVCRSASASAPSPSQLPQPTTVSPLTMTDLLPILLTGVSDPQPSVATLALNLVESVGTAYEASQTATTTQADAPATAPTTAPTSEPMQVDGEAGAGESVSGPGVDVCVAACQLGPPYTGRPGAGARAMARALLSALLPPVIGDLTAWTVSQRAAAVRSLHTLLVLAEDSAQVRASHTHVPHTYNSQTHLTYPHSCADGVFNHLIAVPCRTMYGGSFGRVRLRWLVWHVKEVCVCVCVCRLT